MPKDDHLREGIVVLLCTYVLVLPLDQCWIGLVAYMELWQRKRTYLLNFTVLDKKEDEEDEECARWGGRLEDTISKAHRNGLIKIRECDEILRTMFFKRLSPSLKNI